MPFGLEDTEAIEFLTEFQRQPRFGELSKLIPVAAVLATILFLYWEYVFLHCLRLLQLDLPAEARRTDDVSRGYRELFIFHIMTGMMLYCLGRCILTHPGSIPDGKGWELCNDNEDDGGQENGAQRPLTLVEKKHSGERRHCKWCLKYKPDRCHHCRICNMCVLRMDHHCPWVYNCIGFRNYKYFFLLLVYAAINLVVINFTMFDSVWWSTRVDVSIAMMFALVSGETFATFLMVLTTTFLAFHIWLMLKAMTTVEFCEKSLKKASYNSSTYSLGPYRNICALLGPNPALWLLPMSMPEGDGMAWGNHDAAPRGATAASATPGEGPSAPW